MASIALSIESNGLLPTLKTVAGFANYAFGSVVMSTYNRFRVEEMYVSPTELNAFDEVPHYSLTHYPYYNGLSVAVLQKTPTLAE